MQKALADFRIESDAVVLLSFANGKSYRVDPKDLSRYIEGDDLEKVRKALRLRNQFIRRILPPTAMFVMAIAAVALGIYDVQKISGLMQEKAPTSVGKTEQTKSTDDKKAPQATVAEPQPVETVPAPAPTQQPAPTPAQTATPAAQPKATQSASPQSHSQSRANESKPLHELQKDLRNTLKDTLKGNR